MTRTNIFISIALAVISISFWALLNQPKIEPPWPSRIQGFSFSPMRAWNNPIKHNFPTEDEIDADLKLLANKTNAIRTYSVEGVQARIPALARKHGLNVTLGAWIDANLEMNEEQINTVIQLARENYSNVIRIIIGNEVVLRGDLTVKQLTDYIDRVRNAVDIPVSTAEP